MNRSDYVELRWVISVIRSWWVLILAFTLIIATSTYLISSRIPPVYRASTTLLVQQASNTGISDYNTLRASEQLAITYSMMIDDWQVIETVINRLDLQVTPRTLANRVSAEGIPDTQLLTLSVEHTNPVLAAKIANTIAEEFIEHIQVQQEQRFASLLSSMEMQISEILVQIDETQAEINRNSNEVTNSEGYLDTNLAVYLSTYAMLHRNYEQMRLDVLQASPHVIIVEKALNPVTPVKPRIELFTILAGVVTLMVTIGLVFLFEFLDDTIKTPEDVTKSLGLVTIGEIGKIKRGDDELVMTENPLSPVAEGFRLLRANIRALSNGNPLQTLLITSPGAHEGKSLTVSNLAVAMTQAELNVVAVDADLYQPRLYELFNMEPLLEPRHDKLSKVTLDENSTGQLHLAHIGRLSIHSSGGTASGTGGMLGSKRIQEQLLELTDDADIVLLDTPPVLSVVDTVELAQIVDGVLLVVKSGNTRSQAAQRALESLRQAGTKPLGVVLTAAPIARDSYYAYRKIYQKGRFPIKARIARRMLRIIERVRQVLPV